MAENTLTVLKETVIPCDQAGPGEQFSEEELEHQKRLFRLTGNRAHKPVIHRWHMPEFRAEAIKAGYTWLVGSAFVERFTYAATVVAWETNRHACGVVERESQYTDHYAAITYTGDIPDFALDRLEMARQYGFKLVTIHSNAPLPCSRVEAMRQIDPVMIAWPMLALIQIGSLDSALAQYARESQKRRWSKRFRLSNASAKDMEDESVISCDWGAVIAAWDFDKETKLE